MKDNDEERPRKMFYLNHCIISSLSSSSSSSSSPINGNLHHDHGHQRPHYDDDERIYNEYPHWFLIYNTFTSCSYELYCKQSSSGLEPPLVTVLNERCKDNGHHDEVDIFLLRDNTHLDRFLQGAKYYYFIPIIYIVVLILFPPLCTLFGCHFFAFFSFYLEQIFSATRSNSSPAG
eukprot:TRINITY_DN3250_c0_g2_i2.p1 TRINITY_DN3250_c0_g2~~TRINITY_DN3250_c0_g2_i2.p1  ORF type:complete len:176 (+),score=32.33 TRINITY_DN3250_c0_g2_i2:248-775(+)